MIDIHCHILSGMDDGAKDLQESVAMAKIAYRDGVRHIIATPHFCNSFMARPETQLSKLVELRKALKREGIPVTVTPGNEVRLENAEYIYGHEAAGNFLYLDSQKKFILLEQRWAEYQPQTEEVCRWFITRGTTPIIPHPERHAFFRRQPELLYRLMELGAWTQVTVDSLLGKNGVEAAQFSRQMLQRRQVHVLATDAHNTKRKPNLSKGFRFVKKFAGEKEAHAIFQRMDFIRQCVVAADASGNMGS